MLQSTYFLLILVMQWIYHRQHPCGLGKVHLVAVLGIGYERTQARFSRILVVFLIRGKTVVWWIIEPICVLHLHIYQFSTKMLFFWITFGLSNAITSISYLQTDIITSFYPFLKPHSFLPSPTLELECHMGIADKHKEFIIPNIWKFTFKNMLKVWRDLLMEFLHECLALNVPDWFIVSHWPTWMILTLLIAEGFGWRSCWGIKEDWDCFPLISLPDPIGPTRKVRSWRVGWWPDHNKIVSFCGAWLTDLDLGIFML